MPPAHEFHLLYVPRTARVVLDEPGIEGEVLGSYSTLAGALLAHDRYLYAVGATRGRRLVIVDGERSLVWARADVVDPGWHRGREE